MTSKFGILPSSESERQGEESARRRAKKTKGQRISPLPFRTELPASAGGPLLEIRLQVGRSALGNVHFKLHLLALPHERMPGYHLMLTGRHILNLEGTIFLYDREMRARDRKEKPLHELVLIA